MKYLLAIVLSGIPGILVANQDCRMGTVLGNAFPGAQWNLRGDKYEGLEWNDSVVPKPSKQVVDDLIGACKSTQTNLKTILTNPKASKDTKIEALIDYLGIK